MDVPFCRSCGNQVQRDDRFCETCGAGRERIIGTEAGSVAAPATSAPVAPVAPKPLEAPSIATAPAPAASPGSATPSPSLAPWQAACPLCGAVMAASNLDYHRRYKHGEEVQEATRSQDEDWSWSQRTGVVAALVVLVGVAVLAVAAGGSSDDASGVSTSSTSASGESDGDGVDAEASEDSETSLDRDLERLEAMRAHTSAWNTAAQPLVTAIVDENVSIDEMLETADRELPAMREAADAVAQASLGLEDPEVARIVGAIGRNYQQKYTAAEELVDAVAQEDGAATEASGERLDDLVTEAQDLVRDLVAYLRGEGYKFSFGADDAL